MATHTREIAIGSLETTTHSPLPPLSNTTMTNVSSLTASRTPTQIFKKIWAKLKKKETARTTFIEELWPGHLLAIGVSIYQLQVKTKIPKVLKHKRRREYLLVRGYIQERVMLLGWWRESLISWLAKGQKLVRWEIILCSRSCLFSIPMELSMETIDALSVDRIWTEDGRHQTRSSILSILQSRDSLDLLWRSVRSFFIVICMAILEGKTFSCMGTTLKKDHTHLEYFHS